MKIKSFINLFTQSEDSFEGQEKGEDVILILRKHVFLVYSQLAFYSVSVFVPIIFGLVFRDFISQHGLFSIFIFVSTLWYMFFWIAIFYFLTMYSLNVVVITNRRLIDSSQKGFFNRKISELHLSRVQDISVKTTGIIETTLKFGDIEVQTASEEREFIFRDIPNPEHVKDVIMNLVEKEHDSYKPVNTV